MLKEKIRSQFWMFIVITMESESVYNLFMCSACNELFESSYALERHSLRHNDELSGEFEHEERQMACEKNRNALAAYINVHDFDTMHDYFDARENHMQAVYIDRDAVVNTETYQESDRDKYEIAFGRIIDSVKSYENQTSMINSIKKETELRNECCNHFDCENDLGQIKNEIEHPFEKTYKMNSHLSIENNLDDSRMLQNEGVIVRIIKNEAGEVIEEVHENVTETNSREEVNNRLMAGNETSR